jgi:predicted HAD superfamily Cof-like phosphohydrolase
VWLRNFGCGATLFPIHFIKNRKHTLSFDLVNEFHSTFEVITRTVPNPRVPEAKLRFKLIKEEFGELLDAIEEVDIVEIADALGDIEYVTVGAAQVFGYSEIVEKKVLTLFEPERLRADLEEMDLSTNPLLTAEGQKEILDDIRTDILTVNDDRLTSTFATILYLVRLAGTYYHVDVPDVIAQIHTSNMTKLGADGKPIFREGDRKIMKGENYKTPTEAIEFLLFRDLENADASE